MRIMLCAVSACLVLAWSDSVSADSTADAVAKANQGAYEHAIRCFLANGYASDGRRKAGDAARATAYDTKARQSFDLAYAAGNRIGLNDTKIGRDLDYYQSIELPRFIRDEKYLLSVASTCKALGLM